MVRVQFTSAGRPPPGCPCPGTAAWRTSRQVPEGRFCGRVLWAFDTVRPSAGFSIFVAHEFFDALPVHKFQVGLVGSEELQQGSLNLVGLWQRTQKGWREVLVDVHPERPEQLRLVLAPSPTLASSTLVQVSSAHSHHSLVPLLRLTRF